MSRLGTRPIDVPDGVTVTVTPEQLSVKGPKGELTQKMRPEITIAVDADTKSALVSRVDDSRTAKSMHGLYRSLLQNMVVGVTQGYERALTIVGTGYRVELKGKTLHVQANFGHAVTYDAPEGVEIEVPKATSREQMDFIVRGLDKQKVGEAAAQLRRIRPPDLYKGKGIRYKDENVRKLEGKSFGS